jgi:hypothetical protein
MKKIWLIDSLTPVKKDWRYSSTACPFWQGRQTRNGDSKNQSGDFGRDGGHNPVTGQLFHE